MKSIRTLKRKKGGGYMEMNAMRMRSRSMEYIADHSEDSSTVSPDHWISNRSRSLPRNLNQSARRYSGNEYRTLKNKHG